MVTLKEERPPADKYSVRILTGNRKDAQSLIRDRGLDLVKTEVLDGDERVQLTFFINEQEIADLRKAGYTLDVGENVSELGLKRQSEVAEGDRFEGGRVAPKGLGVVRDGKPEERN